MEWSIDTVPNLYKNKYGAKVEDEKDKQKSFREKIIALMPKPDAAKETEEKIEKNVGAGITDKAKKFKFGAW